MGDAYELSASRLMYSFTHMSVATRAGRVSAISTQQCSCDGVIDADFVRWTAHEFHGYDASASVPFISSSGIFEFMFRYR